MSVSTRPTACSCYRASEGFCDRSHNLIQMGYGFQHFGGKDLPDAVLYRSGELICDCIFFNQSKNSRSQSRPMNQSNIQSIIKIHSWYVIIMQSHRNRSSSSSLYHSRHHHHPHRSRHRHHHHRHQNDDHYNLPPHHHGFPQDPSPRRDQAASSAGVDVNCGPCTFTLHKNWRSDCKWPRNGDGDDEGMINMLINTPMMRLDTRAFL